MPSHSNSDKHPAGVPQAFPDFVTLVKQPTDLTMQTQPTRVRLILLAAASAALVIAGTARADTTANLSPADASLWTKPVWLSDLSLSAKESYDDNVLGVSGLGLPVYTSWVTSVSAKVGVNFLPLLGGQNDISVLSLAYNPESVTYGSVKAEDYIAHRFSAAIKGTADGAVYSFDDAFLYVDGDKEAPVYALNQAAGAAGNQNDKFRNNYAHSVARERRNQIQDRYNASIKINDGDFFIKPISSLTYYNLNTYLFNTSLAPWKGYQDYIDRYDVNGGADFGYDISKTLSVSIGYRDGYQHQDQFALAINSDQHYASNHYQRALFGLEGKLTSWLTAKLSAGPDFRDYNSHTDIIHDRTTRYYGEGSLVAALPNAQSLTLSYKQWEFVSSTGLVPYDDTTLTLAYHWNVTQQLGLDLSAKYLEANYTIGDDYAGTAPDLRDDVDYGASIGFTYAVTKQFIVSLAYNYDDGRNNLDSLPATLFPGYRDFTHSVTTLGVTYKF
jgi:hypothetical protein